MRMTLYSTLLNFKPDSKHSSFPHLRHEGSLPRIISGSFLMPYSKLILVLELSTLIMVESGQVSCVGPTDAHPEWV